MNDTITISRTEYLALKEESLRLECLEDAGVDNWEWYHEALADYYVRRKEEIND